MIDTPGMRELGMWEHEAGIENTFSDIEELAGKCRFSDCTHKSEPGCAIRRALDDGVLSEDRWNSYQKLKVESAYAADEAAYLEAKRNKFKQIAKSNRSNPKR